MYKKILEPKDIQSLFLFALLLVAESLGAELHNSALRWVSIGTLAFYTYAIVRQPSYFSSLRLTIRAYLKTLTRRVCEAWDKFQKTSISKPVQPRQPAGTRKDGVPQGGQFKSYEQTNTLKALWNSFLAGFPRIGN
jgi:hypothetical protein